MTESDPLPHSNDDKPQAATVAHAVLEKFFSELEKLTASQRSRKNSAR
jgi:hypothetical protein